METSYHTQICPNTCKHYLKLFQTNFNSVMLTVLFLQYGVVNFKMINKCNITTHMNLTSIKSGAQGKSGKVGVHDAHSILYLLFLLFAIFRHQYYFLFYPLKLLRGTTSKPGYLLVCAHTMTFTTVLRGDHVTL